MSLLLSYAQIWTLVISRCAISHIGCELYSALVIYVTHYAICVGATLTHLKQKNTTNYYYYYLLILLLGLTIDSICAIRKNVKRVYRKPRQKIHVFCTGNLLNHVKIIYKINDETTRLDVCLMCGTRTRDRVGAALGARGLVSPETRHRGH